MQDRDVWLGGWTDRHKDWLCGEDGLMDAHGWADGRMDGQMDGQAEGQTDKRTDRWMRGCVNYMIAESALQVWVPEIALYSSLGQNVVQFFLIGRIQTYLPILVLRDRQGLRMEGWGSVWLKRCKKMINRSIKINGSFPKTDV